MVHTLRVKWMLRVCQNIGSSWSRYIWWKITEIILPNLIAGAQAIKDSLLHSSPPFYAAMIHFYVYVNDLFYKANASIPLPYNLWFPLTFPFKAEEWCLVGVNMI